MAIQDKNDLIGRIYRKIFHKYYTNDLWLDLKIAAKKEAVDYALTHMQDAQIARDRYDLLTFAFNKANPQGLILEFGVEKGLSINHLASLTHRTVHGFDSFEGLPSNWRGTMETKGKFAMKGQPPSKIAQNVKLHIGWFDKTIPEFVQNIQEPISLIHVDCDIYESAATIFKVLGKKIAKGTVIIFASIPLTKEC